MSAPGVRIYLESPGHDLLAHYDDMGAAGRRLVFTPEFRAAHLPASGSDDFHLETLDASDGRTYTYRMYVAYEHAANLGALDSDFNWREGLTALQAYFYGQHHCPCHRKDYAAAAGAVVEYTEAERFADENGGRDGGYCSGRRFLIKAITCPALPGLVLYSETMAAEELEAALTPAAAGPA